MRSVHFDGRRLHIITAFVLFLEDNSRFQFLACSMLLYCFLTFPILSSPSCGSPRKTNQSLSPFFPTIGLMPCLLFIYPLFLPFQSLFVFTIRPAPCTSFHWELHCWIHALLQRFSKTYYILYFIREKNTVCSRKALLWLSEICLDFHEILTTPDFLNRPTAFCRLESRHYTSIIIFT